MVDPYAHEDQLLSLIMRFPKIRSRIEATLGGELDAFPDLRGDIPTDLREVLKRTENRLVWYAWTEHGPAGPVDLAAWKETLDPALRPHAERLIAWTDEPPLRQIGAEGDGRERANGIALRLRRTVAERRRDEMRQMTQSVEDQEDRAQLARKSQLVLDYLNKVNAPHKSTVYSDLDSRREAFG